MVQEKNMKLCTAVLTLIDQLQRVGGWELLAAGKMLTSNLIPLNHYFRNFFHLDSHGFLYFVFLCTGTAQMPHNLWFEITNLRYEVVKRIGAIKFDQGV